MIICRRGAAWALVLVVVLSACSSGGQNVSAGSTATPPPSATLPPTQTPQPTLTPTATPLPACYGEPGEVVESLYPGAVVDGEIPMVVYLPPCYDESENRYPVLYLLHGFGSGMDETHWQQLGVIEEAEQRFQQGGEEAYIIVMPLQPDPIFINSMGGAGSYEQEMLEGLIPFVDAHYRTLAEPDGRAVGGISRGGVWALEIAFRNPDVFNSVAGLSPALHVNYVWPDYDPYELVRRGDVLPAHIFLSAGDQERDFRLAMLELSAALEEAGVDHSAAVFPGGHENEAWQAVLPDLLDFLSTAW